jgi:hypothetical protein
VKKRARMYSLVHVFPQPKAEAINFIQLDLLSLSLKRSDVDSTPPIAREFMDAAAIHDQINRILGCQSFASKSQLRKLLEVLSQNMDSQTNLTTDLVIKELWPDEIRTKRSADVATEMNRLRHALESRLPRTNPAVETG